MTMNRLVVGVLAVLLLSFTSLASAAPPKRVTAHVEGMACPFCAFNIEKRIKTLKQVPDEANYQASVDEGAVSFDWKADASVDKEAIREQIKKAGFTPGGIEVADGEQTGGDSSAQSTDSEKTNANAAGEGQSISVKAIEQATGVAARSLEGGVVKITWPRNDVTVQVDDRPLPPAAGLTSWASFKPASDGSAVVMGDTVVFPDEVDVAMDAALEHGLSVTALHNHFFHDRPKVCFMHIGGHGSPEKLGAGVKAVWDAIKQVRNEQPQPATRFPGQAPASEGELDADAIGRITGLEATTKPGGVVKVATGREAKAHGITVNGSMGLSSWAAFTGSDKQVAINGDFIMTGNETQPVMRALREHGFHIVALHNHMIGQQPRFYFLHFQASGAAEDLATGFRAALEAQKQAK